MNFKTYLEEYFSSSTIHGLAYLSNKNHWVEKFFWVVFQTISIICTTILITELVLKIQSFPIIIQLSDVPIPVGEINFPAVTICRGLLLRNDLQNESKVFIPHTKREYKEHYEKVFNISEADVEFPLLFEEVPEKLETSGINLNEIKMFTLKRLQIIDLITKSGIFQRQNISIPTDDFLAIINTFSKHFDGIQLYRWHNIFNSYSSEIITDMGLCNTINIANLSDVLHTDVVSHDFHYQLTYLSHTDIHRNFTRPFRTSTSSAGLDVLMDMESDYDVDVQYYSPPWISSLKIRGAYLLIHDPYELPSTDSLIISANVDTMMNIWLNPELIKTDDLLKEYSLKDRNCFLNHEKKLRFFKVYTKTNCEQECLTEFMISHCNCVEFFMIRNRTTRICSANEKSCYDEAKREFKSKRSDCGCLQPCDYVNYKTEIETKILFM
ncbi:hypothetical protein ACKWTF_016044 [Chironomus riparius]